MSKREKRKKQRIRLQQLEKARRKLIDNGFEHVTLQVTSTRENYGTCDGHSTITLDALCLDDKPHELDETIDHEIAHLIEYKKNGRWTDDHGDEFEKARRQVR